MNNITRAITLLTEAEDLIDERLDELERYYPEETPDGTLLATVRKKVHKALLNLAQSAT